MSAWEEIRARNDLAGRIVCYTEDGVVFRGKLESILCDKTHATLTLSICEVFHPSHKGDRWEKAPIALHQIGIQLERTPKHLASGAIVMETGFGRCVVHPSTRQEMSDNPKELLELA